MGFSIFTPLYMYQSPSGYVFRLRIPKDLKHLVGKTEFRYSLATGTIRVAKERARRIAGFVQELLMKVRGSMSEFTTEKINQLVRDFTSKRHFRMMRSAEH